MLGGERGIKNLPPKVPTTHSNKVSNRSDNEVTSRSERKSEGAPLELASRSRRPRQGHRDPNHGDRARSAIPTERLSPDAATASPWLLVAAYESYES